MKPVPRMMVFVPLDPDRARSVRAAGRTGEELPAFAATARMITAHGYRPDEREDADYAAQVYASVSGLRASAADRRLVVAAEVPIARVRDGQTDADYGAIMITGLDWSDAAAVFVDAPEAAEAVRTAKKAVAMAAEDSLTTLLDLPEVIALTDDHELLWHTPEETWS